MSKFYKLRRASLNSLSTIHHFYIEMTVRWSDENTESIDYRTSVEAFRKDDLKNDLKNYDKAFLTKAS